MIIIREVVYTFGCLDFPQDPDGDVGSLFPGCAHTKIYSISGSTQWIVGKEPLVLGGGKTICLLWNSGIGNFHVVNSVRFGRHVAQH
jgi:hypothetical protein